MKIIEISSKEQLKSLKEHESDYWYGYDLARRRKAVVAFKSGITGVTKYRVDAGPVFSVVKPAIPKVKGATVVNSSWLAKKWQCFKTSVVSWLANNAYFSFRLRSPMERRAVRAYQNPQASDVARAERLYQARAADLLWQLRNR